MSAQDLIGVQPELRDYIDSITTAPLDTDGTLAANDDAVAPSQKAVKTYVDTSIAALESKAVEADNAVVVVPGTTVVSTAGTTVLDLTGISADAGEFNIVSAAAQVIIMDFGATANIFAAGFANTGERYLKFTGVVGTSAKIVRLSATSYYVLSTIGTVTIEAAP